MADSNRVFIVEDEAIIAADIAQCLRRLGFQVVGQTGHGERALLEIPAAKPHVVLMDIVIRGPIDGIETARRLRADNDIPVVFLTSHADAETVRKAVGSNPFGYVLKPYNERELQVAIQIALHRHGVESQLRALERWTATVLGSIADGVLATDRAGRVTLINEAARRLTGWEGDAALGNPLQDVYAVSAGEDAAPLTGLVERGLQGACTTGEGIPLQLRRRDGGNIRVGDSVAPIRGNTGDPTGVVIVFRDATAQLKAERMEREQRAAELVSQQRTRFLSRVSHELRTPLNAVLGFSELMERDQAAPLDPSQRSRLGKVRQAGTHLLDLINDVLELTRLDDGARPLNRQLLDLDAVIAHCIDLVDASAQDRGIKLRRSGGARDAVLADRRALEQVLLNLLSNGVKYNRRGGALEISVQQTGTVCTIAVRDEGAGLDAHQLGQLFQPFNRLGAENSPVEGTGLGLVIARSLAEAMGGTLTATSAPGAGTCFTLSLPGATAGAVAADAGDRTRAACPPACTDAATLPAATLLYVEDEPLNALLFSEALRGVPQWHVVLADNGAQGLAMARSLRPDLVLLDINLPALTGDQVVQALRADPATAALRCVALSADAMAEQRQAALDAGFDAYWTKPLELGALVERIRLQLGAPGASANAA